MSRRPTWRTSGTSTRSTASSGGASSAFAEGQLPGAASTPAFDGQDLVVQGAEVQASRRPRLEVVVDSNSSAGARALADGNVLLEGRGAYD